MQDVQDVQLETVAAAEPVNPLAAIECKYRQGDVLKHIGTGTEYMIHVTPREGVAVEASGEYGYGYAKTEGVIGPDNRLWFRAQSEIEDETRYVFVKSFEEERLVRATIQRELEVQYRAELQVEVSRIVAEVGTENIEALFEAVQKGAIEFCARYVEWECTTNGCWALPDAGKAGLPVYMHHKEGQCNPMEISTLFEIPPVKVDRAKWEMFDRLVTHLADPSVEDGPQVYPLRATDEENVDPTRFDYYGIQGFTTRGHGGNQPQNSTIISFQNGNPAAVGWHGVTLETLLAICAHRLEGFQQTEHKCDENASALLGIEHALINLKVRQVRIMNAAKEAK